jgi:hypothetical protein
MFALLPCHCCPNQSTIRTEVMHKEITFLCDSIITTHFSRTVYSGQTEPSILTSAHLHLVPKSRMADQYLHFPLYRYDVVFNELITGTILLRYLFRQVGQ